MLLEPAHVHLGCCDVRWCSGAGQLQEQLIWYVAACVWDMLANGGEQGKQLVRPSADGRVHLSTSVQHASRIGCHGETKSVAGRLTFRHHEQNSKYTHGAHNAPNTHGAGALKRRAHEWQQVTNMCGTSVQTMDLGA